MLRLIFNKSRIDIQKRINTNNEYNISLIDYNNNELESKIYPYPFMESTTIYFSEFKQRTISIMDITGRKLKTINSINIQIDIKADNMKSGMYFIQISDCEKQSIKKIILK